jgi:hypothetical protein
MEVLRNQRSQFRLLQAAQDRMVFKGENGSYHVLGELPMNFAHLRISLVFIPNKEVYRYRYDLDLLNQLETDKITQLLRNKFPSLDAEAFATDLDRLVEVVEKKREDVYNAQFKDVVQTSHSVTKNERSAAALFLNVPQLLDELDRCLVACGIVGEQHNRLLLFLVAISFKTDQPLHALIQSGSSTGKSHLLKVIERCLPPPYAFPITRLSDKAFYHFNSADVTGKCLFLNDLSGLGKEALFGLRELQSERTLIHALPQKSNYGVLQTKTKVIRSHFSSIAATTATQVYLDNSNRSILLHLDDSEHQTQLIIARQNQLFADTYTQQLADDTTHFLQNCISLLQPYKVVNPFAPALILPSKINYRRRTNFQLLSLIQVITLFYQMQREKNESGALIATASDVKIAIDLIVPSLVINSDDLDAQSRAFLTQLKTFLAEQQRSDFTQRDIRMYVKKSKTTVFKLLQSLLTSEYIYVVRGTKQRGFYYALNDATEATDQLALKSELYALIGMTV